MYHLLYTELFLQRYTQLYKAIQGNTWLYSYTRQYMLVACIFPRPCGARKNTTQLVKYPRVLYDKPSNKRFIIPLQKDVILIQFYLLRVFFKKCIICPSGHLRTM